MSAWNLDRESCVAVAGDWHGDARFAGRILPAIGRLAPDVTTILHVGDFGIGKDNAFLKTADYWCARAGIHRILVSPGNHEFWPRIEAGFAATPNEPTRLSTAVWALPRAFRFSIAGRSVLSFGGAASVDGEDRVVGADYWPHSEMPTEADVGKAIAGGPVDVMISHETIDGGVPLVDRVLRSNPLGWPKGALAASALSRQRVTRVWQVARPRVLCHGHMHIADEAELHDGRRVYSLGCNGQEKNVGILRLSDLSWEWLGF
jgi:hypothetical protein